MTRPLIRSATAIPTAWALLACSGLTAPKGVGAERAILTFREAPSDCTWSLWSWAEGEKVLGHTPQCPDDVHFSPDHTRIVAWTDGKALLASWPSLGQPREIDVPNGNLWVERDGSLHVEAAAFTAVDRAVLQLFVEKVAVEVSASDGDARAHLQASPETLKWKVLETATLSQEENELMECGWNAFRSDHPWSKLSGYGKVYSVDVAREDLVGRSELSAKICTPGFLAAKSGGWMGCFDPSADICNAPPLAGSLHSCADAACRSLISLGDFGDPANISLRIQGDYLLIWNKEGGRLYQQGQAKPVHIFAGVTVGGWLPD